MTHYDIEYFDSLANQYKGFQDKYFENNGVKPLTYTTTNHEVKIETLPSSAKVKTHPL